ncbi:MAG: sodium:solute symporter family transporter, partial [Megamonas funiformis]
MTHSLDNNIIPFLAVIITYFGLLTYIGYYATKQTRTLRDYFTMSGKAGALLSGLAYFSTQYSMSTFMGVPGTIYKVGYAGMSVSVPGIAFSMVIPALLVGRRLIRLGHRYRMLTMADYISDRYESTLMRALLAIIMILFLVPMMGAQTIGAGIIFKTYTGAPEWVGIVVMGITVILYCMAGGIRSIMITDVIQGILMVATAVVTFFVSLQLGGGLEVINQHLADTDMSLLSHPGQNNSMPWQNYVSMIIMWSFFTIGQPHLFTKFFTMKNYNVMFKAVLLGTLGMWFSATLIEWCGVTGRMSFPNLTGTDTDFIVPLILQAGVHPVISSLMVAGIFSAGMSTVSGVLITSTSAVTRDLYQKIFNKEATDKDAFIMSRYVT